MWQGACKAGGHTWQGGMHGRGHAWQGRVVHDRQLCMAGDVNAGVMATEVSGTCPTGLHSSCIQVCGTTIHELT